MDLDAVRGFIAVADLGQFQHAAAELSITQQAVSKRVARLERDLGTRLFSRTARGVRLTADGQAFLPHARALLHAAERAVASVRPGRRGLRVDVVGRHLGPAGLLREFHRVHPEVELDVVTLFGADAAMAALRSGAIDASVRAVARPLDQLVAAARVFEEPIQLLTGPRHALAGATSVSLRQLSGHRIWMPSLVAGTEWAAYYAELAAAFGLTVDGDGPNFGIEALADALVEDAAVATFVGEGTRLARRGPRRVVLRDPTPVYPHSLVWHRDNASPALATLRRFLTGRPAVALGPTWTPSWA